jgi:ElaB/YqjD/DUF883 family membrane-anchored ribosome-binding protein
MPPVALPVTNLPQTEDQLEALTKEKLMQDLKLVVQDVEELLKATASQTGEKIAAARARAEESLRGAQRHLFEAGDEAAARARAGADAADEYVRDNPWQAVAIAAGVAFIIGLLVGRR